MLEQEHIPGLLHTVANVKAADTSPSSNTGHHRGTVGQYGGKFLWAPKGRQYFPETLTTDCVEVLGEVNNGGVEVLMLLLALFLNWSYRAAKIMSTVPRPGPV